MNIKLRLLAEKDSDYAKMLRDFFENEGKTDYLDMTLEEFLDYCERKLDCLTEKIFGAMKR